MSRLVDAQRMVLQAILDAQGDSENYVEDRRIAESTKITLRDIRNWFVTLKDDGYIDLARTELGNRASITAKGRLELSRPHTPDNSGPKEPRSLLSEVHSKGLTKTKIRTFARLILALILGLCLAQLLYWRTRSEARRTLWLQYYTAHQAELNLIEKFAAQKPDATFEESFEAMRALKAASKSYQPGYHEHFKTMESFKIHISEIFDEIMYMNENLSRINTLITLLIICLVISILTVYNNSRI